MATTEYYQIISRVADDVRTAMRTRMVEQGDWTPLFVYVSPVDGTWEVAPEGEHPGYWRTKKPVTAATAYLSVGGVLANQMMDAPLYAGRQG